MIKKCVALLLICACQGCEVVRREEFKAEIAQPPAAPRQLEDGKNFTFFELDESKNLYLTCVSLGPNKTQFVFIVPYHPSSTTALYSRDNVFSDAYLIPQDIYAGDFMRTSRAERDLTPGISHLHGSVTERWKTPEKGPEEIDFNFSGTDLTVSGHNKFHDGLALDSSLQWLFTWTEAFGGL